MALTRKLLKSMGLTDEQIESVIEAHTETVDALKNERDTAKEEAKKVTEIQTQLDEANKKLQNAGDAAKVQADFDAYKKQIENEKTNAGKTEAVKKALKDAGVNRDEFIELLMDKVDLSAVNIADGKLTDNTLIEGLKKTYTGCFGTIDNNGINRQNPPGNGQNNNDMTDAEYYAQLYANKK